MNVELVSEPFICSTLGIRDFERVEENLRKWSSPIFADMWKFHNPLIFTEMYDSAALEVQKNQVIINFNPEYWHKSGQRHRCFIIVHELLHYMFGHAHVPKNMDPDWANIAQDIQVNEYIQTNYPELTHNMRGKTNHAWISTVFKHKAHLVEKNRDYVYYYNLLMDCL